MSSSALPHLTSRQVKEVDALCEERFGISTDWLMEAAGWVIARFCDRRTVTVVCGVGNNAGDGLAAARHLHRRGNLRAVCCIDPERLRGAPARELDVLRRIGVEISTQLVPAPQMVDAIFGTGLSRAPEGRFAEWIAGINATGAHVVAVDVPSGLNAETGLAYSPMVQPDLTVTLGLPKKGLSQLKCRVIVADIGVPFEAYEALGIAVPRDLFAKSLSVEL